MNIKIWTREAKWRISLNIFEKLYHESDTRFDPCCELNSRSYYCVWEIALYVWATGQMDGWFHDGEGQKYLQSLYAQVVRLFDTDLQWVTSVKKTNTLGEKGSSTVK